MAESLISLILMPAVSVQVLLLNFDSWGKQIHTYSTSGHYNIFPTFQEFKLFIKSEITILYFFLFIFYCSILQFYNKRKYFGSLTKTILLQKIKNSYECLMFFWGWINKSVASPRFKVNFDLQFSLFNIRFMSSME